MAPAPALPGWLTPEAPADSCACAAHLGARVGFNAAAHASAGSNGGAVDNNQTMRGKPLSCSDLHLAVHELPGPFFEVRVRLPGGAYWLGDIVPGLPVVAIGRNAQVA